MAIGSLKSATGIVEVVCDTRQSSKLTKTRRDYGDFILEKLSQEASYRNDVMLFKTQSSNQMRYKEVM